MQQSTAGEKQLAISPRLLLLRRPTFGMCLIAEQAREITVTVSFFN